MGNCGSSSGVDGVGGKTSNAKKTRNKATPNNNSKRNLSSTTETSATSSGECRRVKKQDITALIQKQSWEKLRTYLKSERGKTDLLKCSTDRDFVDQHILHTLCAYQPPGDVVEQFLDVLGPDLLGVHDGMRQLPLHTACAFDAGRDAVGALLDGCKMASRARDDMGMTPLAVLCANAGPSPVAFDDNDHHGNSSSAAAASAPSNNKKAHFHPPHRAIFRDLIHAHPAALVLTDNWKRTPLQLAEQAGASEGILHGLRKDTFKVRTKLVQRGMLKDDDKKGGSKLGSFSSTMAIHVTSSILLPSQVEFPTNHGDDGDDRSFDEEEDAPAGSEEARGDDKPRKARRARQVSDLSIPTLPQVELSADAWEEQEGEDKCIPSEKKEQDMDEKSSRRSEAETLSRQEEVLVVSAEECSNEMKEEKEERDEQKAAGNNSAEECSDKKEHHVEQEDVDVEDGEDSVKTG